MFCSAKSRKLVFCEDDDCHPTLTLNSFTNNGWSLRLLEKTWQQLFLWVVNLCLLCIAVAREIFLLQSDCSAITWISVFTADFSRIIQALLFCETSSPLLRLVWVARTKLNSKKSLESFLSLPSIFGYLGKETNNIVLGQAPALCFFW